MSNSTHSDLFCIAYSMYSFHKAWLEKSNTFLFSPQPFISFYLQNELDLKKMDTHQIKPYFWIPCCIYILYNIIYILPSTGFINKNKLGEFLFRNSILDILRAMHFLSPSFVQSTTAPHKRLLPKYFTNTAQTSVPDQNWHIK